MSKLIKIGLPSKGRLKDQSLKIFKKKKIINQRLKKKLLE